MSAYNVPWFNQQSNLCIEIPGYHLPSFAGQQPWAGEASALFDVQTKYPKADPDLSNSVS